MFRVYTDGACHTESRRGGWAALLIGDGQRLPLQGAEANTTSNRMELMAAIQGLSHIPPGAEVTLHSDSEYLVKTMTKGWKRRANTDLWAQLDRLAQERRVHWQWQPGESLPELEDVHRRAVGLLSTAPPSPQGVRMVDVSPKPVTHREAQARALVKMSPLTLRRILQGEVEKGDVLTAARLAGIMAAKRTPELIPLCHPLPLDQVQVDCQPREEDNGVEVRATVRGEARTGYEMEALMAVAVGALTIYDMCKAYDPAMSIEIKLTQKSGGKSGEVRLG